MPTGLSESLCYLFIPMIICLIEHLLYGCLESHVFEVETESERMKRALVLFLIDCMNNSVTKIVVL